MEVRTPTPAELAARRDQVGPGPVVLVNLIRFREPGGATRFDDYTALSAPLMAAAGATVEFLAAGGPDLSGDGWDFVAHIRFPSIDACIEMIGSAIYQNDAGRIREEALERTIWMVTQPPT